MVAAAARGGGVRFQKERAERVGRRDAASFAGFERACGGVGTRRRDGGGEQRRDRLLGRRSRLCDAAKRIKGEDDEVTYSSTCGCVPIKCHRR